MLSIATIVVPREPWSSQKWQSEVVFAKGDMPRWVPIPVIALRAISSDLEPVFSSQVNTHSEAWKLAWGCRILKISIVSICISISKTNVPNIDADFPLVLLSKMSYGWKLKTVSKAFFSVHSVLMMAYHKAFKHGCLRISCWL